ncbi:MAG: hypothetical protein V4568_06720 [Pseudomonadota bacterium]
MSDIHIQPAGDDEFDIGQLSWVKSEITFALARADEGITEFGANPDDRSLPHKALSHIHQVTGALHMVGLTPVAVISEAIEKLMGALDCGDIKPNRDLIGAVRSAIKALNRFLEGLMRGERNRPLVLYPEYRSVLVAAGQERASAVDLFFPVLSRHPRFTDNEVTLRAGELTNLMALKREEFRKGLLQVLRDVDYQQNLVAMTQVVADVDAVQPAETKMLWWILFGFLEGLTRSPTSPGEFQKQLCGRIDIEFKHQIEGTKAVSERFLREYLFAVAYLPPDTPRLREIHDAYQLRNLLPPKAQENPENTRVKILLSDIRAQLVAVQDTWSNFTAGKPESLRQFANETAQLNSFGRSITNKSLRAMFTKLAEVGNELISNPRDPNGEFEMEIATMLLSARDALDNHIELGANFDSMTQTQVVRVSAAFKNRPLPSGPTQFIDVRRTAQDRTLFLTLGQDSLAILSRIEDVLDAFFQDPATHADLTCLPKYIKQLEGVLTMLESKDSVNLLNASHQLVQKMIAVNGPPDHKDTELVAEAFSHLGLFVVAIQQGYENPGDLLQPLLVRFGITPS